MTKLVVATQKYMSVRLPWLNLFSFVNDFPLISMMKAISKWISI